MMHLGIVARIGAGKDEAARIICTGYGFEHFSLSDEVRHELRAEGIEVTRQNITERANLLRATAHPSELARRAFARAQGRAVFSSLRNLEEIAYLRAHANNFFILGIDAPIEIRYERIIGRGRVGDGMTLEQLIEVERSESEGRTHEMQLGKCVESADEVIVNNKTLEDFSAAIDRFMQGRGFDKMV